MPDPVSSIIRRLRRAVAPEERRHGDGELLRRFIAARDQEAFAEIVRRHGGLVFAVSRSLLGSREDAEDVFQATFLVLARKAAAVRKQASLAAWLHGVARRLSLKLRARSLRREELRRALPPPAAESTMDDMTWRELRGVLHEEVARLPEKLRLPVLLCHWEGHTQEEAARQLGCPKATLKDRLERARERLRGRLLRRGVVPAVSLFAAWLAGHTPAEAVPPALADATSAAALSFAAGQAAAVSPRVTALARGALTAMLLGKVKVVTALVLLLAVAAGAAIAAWRPFDSATPPGRQPQPPAPPRQAADASDEPLPAGALRRLGTLKLRQGKQIVGLSFSADGKRLATGSSDDAVNLWDATTGKLLKLIRDQERDLVQSVALSPDGKWIAAGYQRGLLRLFDAETGQEVRRFEGLKEHVAGILFSPDGKTLFAGEIQNPAVHAWDVATGKELRTFTGHERGTKSLSLSADGSTLAGCGYDSQMVVWDVASGKEVGRWSDGKSDRTYAVALSPDGKLLAGGGDYKGVRVWDATSGREVRRLDGPAESVGALAFSPDGRILVSGGRDRTVFAWDPATGRELYRLREPTNYVRAVAFTPDGKTLAVATGSAVLLYEAATGKLLTPVEGHLGEVYALAKSPDGRLLATGGQDGSVILWDAEAGKQLRRLEGHPGSEVYAVAFSPDGRLLASGGNDGKVKLWRVGGELAATYECHRSCVGFLNFFPDGKRLVSVDWFDAGLIVWDLCDGDRLRETGKQLSSFKLHDKRASFVAFSPDGKTVASADDPEVRFGGIDTSPKLIRLWDLETGKEVGKLDGHRGSQIRGMAFSPDGRLLASGGTYFGDNVIRIWDVAARKEIATLPSRAEALAFSPDGRTLAAVPEYYSTEVVLWELATGAERGRLAGHRDPTMRVEFLDGGRKLVSVSRDTTVLIWDLAGRSGPLKADEVEGAWRDFLGGDAVKSYQALQALAAVPEQTLPHVRELLKRADADRLKRLITDLDSERFEVRDAADKELDRLALTAESALRKASEEGASVEVRRRTARLVEQVPVRATRLVELLELAGTPEATRLLEEAAKAADTKLGQEAKAAVSRRAAK